MHLLFNIRKQTSFILMLFEFAAANFYRSAYTDEISHVKFANLISVSILKFQTSVPLIALLINQAFRAIFISKKN